MVNESVVRAIASRARGDGDSPRVIAVAAPPVWEGPGELETQDGTVEVHPVVSVLALRELLADRPPADGKILVLLTSIPEDELGDEVLAQLWRHRVQRPSAWEAAKELFRVDRMDPALANHRWLVDHLVEVAPPRGFAPPQSGFLDLETAWKNLLRFGLRLDVERPGPEDLLRWGESEVAHTVLQGRLAEVSDAIIEWLGRTAGPVARHVVRLAADGRGRDLIPLGLLCDALWNDELDDDRRVTAARVRLEGPIGERSLTGEVARAWGEAAVSLVRRAHSLSDDGTVQEWVSRAESLLARTLDVPDLAFASDVLPSGFEQRLGRAGSALGEAFADQTEDAREAVRQAVEHVGRHLRAADGEDRDRCERLQMGERLLRSMASSEPATEGDLADAARAFVADGAWVDRAREALGHGETQADLAGAYGEILKRVDALRAKRDEAFAQALAGWSAVEPGDRPPLLPIERVLDRVVVPIARELPVLLLVLDGWSHPEATRMAEDLGKIGWVRRGPASVEDEHPIVVSALPSVTSVSRASLLTGRLQEGNQNDERRGWAEHQRLGEVSRGGSARLFHRRDLGTSGGHIAPEVRDTILDPDVQVVGVVVNALDEHLDKGGQLRLADGLKGIRPLRPLLDAAVEAGRAVVLASDHGHVLEFGSSVRVHGGAGERWRPNHPPAEEGEVELKGPRVLFDQGSIVVPTTEKLRYMSAEKRGYHGGATPQEVLCPLMIIAPPSLEWSGSDREDLLSPSWWELRRTDQPARPVREDTQETWRRAEPAPLPPVDPDGQGQLFGAPTPEDEAAADAPSRPQWVEALVASPVLEAQRKLAGRQALGDADLTAFLELLDAAGGVLPVQAVSERLGVPMSRVFSKLAALQRMLNVDGYVVVAVEGDRTVRFDRERLREQFQLGS